ncbi:hypothetical protein GCM10009867_19450 [Pedococcus aerophilus]|uniref:Uncharacterized protein n=1 Tax=Pedococcus aerophilus TaxID=436356 RepID=A0ABN3UNE0_9MICO
MSPLAATRSVLGSLAAHAHAPYPHPRIGRRAPLTGSQDPVQRKDFGAVPVCGSVRPLASQRELRDRG